MDRKAYFKEYYQNKKEYIKEQNKEYRENNKEHKKAYDKEYRQNNKEYFKEYSKEYNQTEKAKMIIKISSWERQGVIYPDMKELYYTWKMTKYCHYCWILLVEGIYGVNKKCLDHDHETGEPRGVICNTCNTKDVFKNC